MAQHDSDDLKNELTRLLAKSRQLRDRSGTLDEEIQRLTRIIAGTAERSEEARSDEQGAEDRPAPPRLSLTTEMPPRHPLVEEVERVRPGLRRGGDQPAAR
jgi:hypothetical protein